MTCYSIYLSGKQGANPKHFQDVGLGTLVTDWSPEFADVLEHGPDGKHGLLATWRTGNPEDDPYLDPSHPDMEWRPLPPAENRPQRSVWIGTDKQRPVRPGCIRRKGRFHMGRQVKLADDQWWTVPEIYALPHILEMDEESGELHRIAKDDFAEISKRAGKYAAVICEQIGILHDLMELHPDRVPEEVAVDFTLEEAWGFACDVLSANYRLCPEVASALKLFDESSVVAVCSAAVGAFDIIETKTQQKKTRNGVSIPVTSDSLVGDSTQ